MIVGWKPTSTSECIVGSPEKPSGLLASVSAKSRPPDSFSWRACLSYHVPTLLPLLSLPSIPPLLPMVILRLIIPGVAAGVLAPLPLRLQKFDAHPHGIRAFPF